MNQAGFDFGVSLTEKYRPSTLDGFAGLAKPKTIMQNFCKRPRDMAFLFVGSPGTGKTTMALAVAAQLQAEVHHVPSQDCKLDTLQRVCYSCAFVPMMGNTCHVVIVDEADQMSNAAQLYLLSKLDSTDSLKGVIWIFTANATDRLEERFLSRCMRVDFSTYGIQADAVKLMTEVWTSETFAEPPNFARIIKEANGNIREALQVLDRELLMIDTTSAPVSTPNGGLF